MLKNLPESLGYMVDVPGDIEQMNQQSLPKAAAMLQEKKHKGK